MLYTVSVSCLAIPNRWAARRLEPYSTYRSSARKYQFIAGDVMLVLGGPGHDRGGAYGCHRGERRDAVGDVRAPLDQRLQDRRGAGLGRADEHLRRHRVDHAQHQLGGLWRLGWPGLIGGRGLCSPAEDAQPGVAIVTRARATAPGKPAEQRDRHVPERVQQRDQCGGYYRGGVEVHGQGFARGAIGQACTSACDHRSGRALSQGGGENAPDDARPDDVAVSGSVPANSSAPAPRPSPAMAAARGSARATPARGHRGWAPARAQVAARMRARA